MKSVDQALNYVSSRLREGGIREARFESRILLSYVLGASREQLLLGYKNDLAEEKFNELMGLAERRADSYTHLPLPTNYTE